MTLEVTAEERHVVEVVFPCYFLYALAAGSKLELELQYGVVVDDVLGSLVGHLARNESEVFGCDVHLRGVVSHVARQFVVALHKHHEAVEHFAHTWRLAIAFCSARIALQVFVETYEEGLEL